MRTPVPAAISNTRVTGLAATRCARSAAYGSKIIGTRYCSYSCAIEPLNRLSSSGTFMLFTPASQAPRRVAVNDALDGDTAIESRIAGAEDLTHAAGSKGVDDLVRAEARAAFDCGDAPYCSVQPDPAGVASAYSLTRPIRDVTLTAPHHR